MEDLNFWIKMATCFIAGAVARLFTTLMQQTVPSIRETFFGACFSGTSGVALALCLMYFKPAESSRLLYLVSLAGGLCNMTVLTALWTNMMPSIINYIVQRFTGKVAIEIAQEKRTQDSEPVKPSANDVVK